MKILTSTVKRFFSKAFNTSILQKNRMAWVDYLRGIAILMVVYRHVLIGIRRSGIVVPEAYENANMVFFSFRMPLFFILSGIFIGGSIKRKPFNQLLYTKFESLLYPYLIWSFIQISIQILLSRFTNTDRGLIDYSYILYQPRNLDQFWYLPALFNATMIYLFTKVKLKIGPSLQLILGLIFYFTAHYFQRISIISDWMEFYLFFALGDAIATFFFKESTQRFLKSKLVFLCVIPIFALVQVYYLRHAETLDQLSFLFIALAGCVSMFIFAFRLQNWNIFSFLRVLGYHSLYIYVMHVMAAAFIRAILVKVFGIQNVGLLLFFGMTAGVIIPVMFYNLLVKNNVLWFLFSLRKTKEAIPKNESSDSVLLTQQ